MASTLSVIESYTTDSKCTVICSTEELYDEQAVLDKYVFASQGSDNITPISRKTRNELELSQKLKVIKNEHNVVYKPIDYNVLVVNGDLTIGMYDVKNKHGLPVVILLDWYIDNISSVESSTGLLKIIDNEDTKMSSHVKSTICDETPIYSENDDDEQRVSIRLLFKIHDNELRILINGEPIAYQFDSEKVKLDIPIVRKLKLNDTTQLELLIRINLRLHIDQENVLLKSMVIDIVKVRIVYTENYDYKQNDVCEKILTETIPVLTAIDMCKTSMTDMKEIEINTYYVKFFQKYKNADVVMLYKHLLTLKNKSLIITVFEYILKSDNDITTKCLVFLETINSDYKDSISMIICHNLLFSQREVYELDIVDKKIPKVFCEYKHNFIHNLINSENISHELRTLLMIAILPLDKLKIVINSGLTFIPHRLVECIKKMLKNEEIVAESTHGLLDLMFKS